MQSVSRLVRVSFAAVLLFLLASSLTSAAGDGASFGLRPIHYDPNQPATQSYFVLDAQPSQVIQEQARLTNTGTAAGTARLYAVDGTTGQTSGSVFLGETDPRTDAGAWIAVDQSEVTLNPGESRDISFTVTVPQQVRPGQHLGGLVAQNTAIKHGDGTGALQVNVQTRTITAVQVNLPGPVVEHISVSGISSKVQANTEVLSLGLHNDGTMMLKPTGSLTVSDASGQQIQNLSLKLDTFLPDTSIDYPVAVPGQALAPGQYHADLELHYGAAGTTTFSSDFNVSAEQTRVETNAAPQQPAPAEQAAQTQATQPSAHTSTGLSGSMIAIVATVAVALIALALIARSLMLRRRRQRRPQRSSVQRLKQQPRQSRPLQHEEVAGSKPALKQLQVKKHYD